MNFWIGVLVFAALPLSVLGAVKPEKKALPPPACSSRVWPFSRDLSMAELIGEAKALPREEVIRLAVGELTREGSDSLDIPLLNYLHSTEDDDLTRGFYGGMAYLSYGKELKQLVPGWPKRPARVQKLSKVEVCRLYLKMGKEAGSKH